MGEKTDKLNIDKYNKNVVNNLVDSDFRINNDKVFLKQHVFKGNAGFIVFHTDWCPHCKDMVPVIDFLAEQLKPYNILFGSIDCDKEPHVSDALKIEGLPSFYFVKKNGRLSPYEGSRDVEDLLLAIVKKNTE